MEVGTLDGASYGSIEVTIEGDSVLPVVVSMDPMGASTELFDEVNVEFSEVIRESSISGSTVSLEGPLGAVALASAGLDDTGRALILETTETRDAGEGAYVLTISSLIADEGGNNQLAGAFDGQPGDYVGQFGAVGDEALELSSCVASTLELVVDGDDGSLSGDAVEADHVEIQASSIGAPTWWLLEVRDANAQRIRTLRTPGSGSFSATVTWDGRGDDGIVNAAGTYWVSVSSIDVHDNISAPCEIEVVLLQRYRPPESL